ncbi:MAG: OsmC family protein [Magnetococcales bacterium]|nr:OsmC family protein [Magnetococcales bacterium]MBF0420463.1 OsmC family protein [Magnetococcales bacterium]MBF0436269.1 OsmC family protein [Magnetococcales bacterium]
MQGLPDISVHFSGGKKVDATFDKFTVKTDQKVIDGGEDSAPQPFMLFLSSLATCAGIFVLGYCQSRGIDTTGISLTQTHDMLPDGQGRMRLGRIGIRITVPPGFPERERQMIKRVAEQCAVKKVIDNPPDFLVETSEGSS